jgi:hypothetical protein
MISKYVFQNRLQKPWLLAVLFAFVASGTVSAQGTGSSDKTQQVASSMSPKQIASGASRLLQSIKNVHSEILDKLKKAKTKQDLVAVDCLGNKITNTKALQLLAEKDNLSLREAVANGKKGKYVTLYVRISQTEGRARDEGAKASQCWGIKGIYAGQTLIRVDIPDSLKKGDPTQTPFKEGVVYRPSNASGFF